MTSDDRDEPNDSSRSGRGETSREIADVKADLGQLVAAHPVGALAVALGAGYALGGGVFTRLTSSLLRVGIRLGIQLAVMPLIEQELATLVGVGGSEKANGAGTEPERETHH
jgi:hypothetical protein